MSGGSFNYLYLKEAAEVMHTEELDEMLQALSQLGYADDVAQDVKDFIGKYEQLQQTKEKLNGVFWAVEWWRSGDQGEDTVKEHLHKYREAKKQS